MKLLNLLIGAWLLAAMQLYAAPGTTQTKPLGVNQAMRDSIRSKLKPIDRHSLTPRFPAVQPNKDITDRINKRGIITPERIKNKLEFFTGDDMKILRFNGKPANPIVSINDIRSFHHAFMVARTPGSVLPDDQFINQLAHEWWQKNQRINYMPLRVSLVNYFLAAKDATLDKDNQVFFAVSPFFTGATSQLITFGFEDDFFVTNTGKTVLYINLNINGDIYTINHKGSAAVSFNTPGEYTIPVEVTMQDGSILKSSFAFTIQPLADGTWSNSKINENGYLEFIY